MIDLICINEDGVVWVETECGKVFGIVNAFNVLDEEGVKYESKSLCDLLDQYCDIDQDWESESNIINLKSNAKLVITADNVEYIA